MNISKSKILVPINIILSAVTLVIALVALATVEGFVNAISSANDFYLPGMEREPYFAERSISQKVSPSPSLVSTVYATQKSLELDKQKIIRTADIRFEVENYKTSRTNIEEIIQRNGGYISSELEEHDNFHIKNSLTIRVPSDKFFNLIEELLVESIGLDSKNITSEDVTEQYVDIQARLKTKREIEARYLNILRQASKVADILDIEEQLGKIREEIESTQSRLNTLESKIVYSTINLRVYETIKQVDEAKNKFLSKVGNSFKQGWSRIIILIVFIISLWPFILICGALLFFYLKFRRNVQQAQS